MVFKMKKEMMLILVFALFFVSIAGVSAEACKLDISLINQDPYPANPGDYVKLVFQIEGISNPECGTVDFELLEQYPLVFDPGYDAKQTIQSGVYNRDYRSFFLASYKVRVDKDAMDGSNPMEVRYSYGSGSIDLQEQFDLEIEDTRADFEIYIKEYDSLTKTLTFEILNIAEADIEALTIEIPKQENIVVKNSNKVIVGDLDSNDYTSADFQATPSEGEIDLVLHYTDSINKRRSIEKKVVFESEYFEGRVEDQNGSSFWNYFIWILLALGVGWYFWRRHKKRKAAKNKRK
jgi:hypothetical protein